MLKFYAQFLREDGMREKINDINNPKIRAIGDIVLPINSLYHYVPDQLGRIGPENVAPFLGNYPKRMNMYFWEEYERVLDPTGIKIRPIQKNKVEMDYFKSHFNYSRAKNYRGFIGKEKELLINNFGVAFAPVDYFRKTIYTGFNRHYNNFTTIFNAVNHFSEVSNRHQFLEIPLPPVFPSYIELKQSFDKYKLFFDEEGNIVKYNKDALKRFNAFRSYWLLDLYGYLLGFGNEKYSLFNKLTPESQSQLTLIFTYNGKCWIANLKTLSNLIGYADKPSDKELPGIKINYFKKFYINLISLVNQITLPQKQDTENEENEPGERETNKRTEEKGRPILQESELETSADLSSDVDRRVNDSEGRVPVRDYDERKEIGENTHTTSSFSESESVSDRSEWDDNHSEENEHHWGDDVPDEIFKQVVVEDNVVNESKNTYTPIQAIDRLLKEEAKKGRLTQAEKDYYQSLSESYKEIEVDGRTLEEIIDIKSEDMVIDNPPMMNDDETIVDKSVLHSRAYMLTRGYTEKLLERNILEMITYVQNSGVCLMGLEKTPVVTADSAYDVYKFRVQPVKGKVSTRTLRVPKVYSDGTFKINGVKSYMQIQRMEKPVRKISPTKVQLTSYYDKPRLIIERSTKVVNDYQRWLKLRIIEASKIKEGFQIQLGNIEDPSKPICYYYHVLASRFASIRYQGYHFNFDTVSLLKDLPNEKELIRLCNKETWVIGLNKDNVPYVIDNQGLVSLNDEVLGYIENLLDLNIQKAPLPLGTININGYAFPLVVVLSYWVGFSTLLKYLKTEYRTSEPGKRVLTQENEYVVSFADEKMIFDRRDELSTLILSGLTKIPALGELSRSQLDDPNIWFSLMSDGRIKPTHFKEMSNMFDMFIDPITKRLLEKDKYPIVLDRLVVAATKLLLNNYAPAETEIEEQRFVGYERFAGHVYRELCKAGRQYKNKPNNGQKTFDLNPEAIMLNILTDSSNQKVEEVNPVHQLKQQEEVTYGGTLGRSEQAMVRRTRGHHDNYVGVVSEAGKDSGKIGFVSYLTVDPKIDDYYGNVNTKEKPTQAGLGSVTFNLLYGGNHDDSIRAMFASVQQSQVMGATGYVTNPIRTSMDKMVSHRTSELYSSVAKDNGKIISVDEHGITVEYDNKQKDYFSLGLEIGIGAGENHRHNKVTDVKVGETFNKGKVLAWDEMFFERDTISLDQVSWKSGVMARIWLSESQSTYEDSIALTTEFANRVKTPLILNESFRIFDNQEIKFYTKLDDQLDYYQVICDIEDPSTASLNQDDAEMFSGLDRLGIKQIHAPQTGRVVYIDVLYNGEVSDFSPSVQKLIKQYDGIRAKRAVYREMTGSTGNVGGNTSVGKSKIYPGSVQVNVYIENMLSSTTADKFVIGNQMKGTVGYIYPTSVKTLDGRPVDLEFSLKSMFNRKVLSLRNKLVANEYNNVRLNRIIEKHEGKSEWRY